MRVSIKSFIQQETAGGIILMLAAALAILIANSSLADLYHHILDLPVGIGVMMNDYTFGLRKPLVLWINDALMALFFLLVGLEIKREVLMGELSSKEKSLQPLFAAIGGIALPAGIFLMVSFNHGDIMRGWAIPCATDIAFALGILMLVGKSVPQSIKVLLTAIAIIDDLAAILIIAFFYSGTIGWGYLLVAAVGILGLALLNVSRVNRIAPYILFGIVVWVGFLKSGIHPTLAGVTTALAIPLQTKRRSGIKAPLIRLEHALHAWIIFAVMPIFALANAGLSFDGLKFSDIADPLPMGIILGLVVGKPVGILGGLAVGHWMGLARKPSSAKWLDYMGMSMLCGIGFTMALFIGELAFDTAEFRNEVRMGVLSASLLSAVIGWGLCRFSFRHK